MSKPMAEVRGPENTECPKPPTSAPIDLAAERDASAVQLGDESPTIISRLMPCAARPEDVFTTTLRGRRLAHFELIEPIGIGGMAAVIRARDANLDRTVALKILPPEMAADPENVRRFENEAKAAAKLDHE